MPARTGKAQPLVSVVVPTFDRPDYLRLAVAAVVTQTYKNLEIIVQDNGSTQDPAAVLASIQDPRLTIYRNERNIGQTPNILAGVARANGKYVAILGDDDLWDPAFVATLVEPMESDPEVVVAFCDHHIIDSQGRVDEVTTEKVTRRFGRHLLREGSYRPFDEIALIYRAICVVSGSLIRRAAVDWSQVPTNLPASSDIYIAYLLAVSGGKCWYTPRRLLKYRYHFGQTMRAQPSRLNYATWTLDLWLVFLHDVRLRNHGYFKMVCARWATLIVLDRLIRRDWSGARSEISRFFSLGLIDPRVLLLYLSYLVRFQIAGVRRLMP
jgi:glycosyltransferase involved in cell wall biosynthesis